MKKLIITFFVFFFATLSVSADYYTQSINSFITSPSVDELDSIEDSNLKYCEEAFLKAFMRREFTDQENNLCSDIFEQKIEDQMNYMRYVMWERGVY